MTGGITLIEVHHLYKIGDSGAVKVILANQRHHANRLRKEKMQHQIMGGLPHTDGRIQRGQAGTSITSWTRRWWGMQSVLVQQAVASTALGQPLPQPPPGTSIAGSEFVAAWGTALQEEHQLLDQLPLLPHLQ